MKLIYSLLCAFAVIFMSCGTEAPLEEGDDNKTSEIFETNSTTVAAYLKDWQNENVDYEKYFASDFESWPTAYGDTDTTNLEQNIEWDQYNWERYDFEIADELNLLPGVNVDTKQMDGSVRYYANWKITKSATDSTEERSAYIKMYQAYVFNEEGKISMNLTYGDFSGMMQDLNGSD